MSNRPSMPAAGDAADISSSASVASNAGSNTARMPGAAAKKSLPEQNPAFRMMGLPRLRLPSRNWMIFLSLTGSFAGAVIYDRWQTKRMREKWCKLVSHLAEEPLDTKTAPRKLTIYLSAPPADGLRSAREHFHTYVKPILVSAAMDWDVVEGRKEGDIRHKTAEKIRKRRKRNGEGEPASTEEDATDTVESIREKNGDIDYPGVAGDIVIGRHTWKEYIRGIHEGFLGPADAPKNLEGDVPRDATPEAHAPGYSTTGDATVKAATELASQNTPQSVNSSPSGASPIAEESKSTTNEATPQEAKVEDEEKPKRRFPAPYIVPDDYRTASLSLPSPPIIGPSIGVRMPHLLGIRNTPTRIYRFLTRRRLQDDVGRQVAAAILASHRPYSSVSAVDDESVSDAPIYVPEQKTVLEFEEKDWWKTVRQPRKEHEESVWIEPVVLDERITSRMQAFQLTVDEEERAKRLEARTAKPWSTKQDDS